MPSKSAVAEISQNLLHLMFPGFYDNDPLRGHDIPTSIRRQLEDLQGNLKQEIQKSLEYQRCQQNTADMPDVDRIVDAFLEELPIVRESLSKDVQAAYEGDPAATSFEEIILSYPGIEAIAIYRLSHELHKLGVPLIPRMMTEWVHARTGIDIHPGAKIDSHFFIDHGTGVVIGETTVIGHHVKIYQGVTLGGKSTAGGQSMRGSKRHPTIGNNVTIYSGASILGGEVVIGNDTTIGGNVFLLQSVPADHRVFSGETSVIIEPKSRNQAPDFQI